MSPVVKLSWCKSRQSDRDIGRQSDRETERQRYKDTGRQSDSQTEKQRYRETEIQGDRETVSRETEIMSVRLSGQTAHFNH